MRIERLTDCLGVQLIPESDDEANTLVDEFGSKHVVHTIIIRSPESDWDLIALGDDHEAILRCDGTQQFKKEESKKQESKQTRKIRCRPSCLSCPSR